MKRWRGLPIPRYAVALMVGALAVSVLSAVLLSRWMARTARQDVLDTYQRALTQAAVTLDDRMETVRAASAVLARDVRLLSALDNAHAEAPLARQLADIRPLREMIAPLLLRKDILRVRLYLQDAHMLSREGVHFFPMSQVDALEGYERLETLRSMDAWVGQHTISLENVPHQAMSLIRTIRSDTRFDQVQAVLVLDVPAAHLTGALSSLSGAGEDAHSLLLMDALGQVVASTGAQQGVTAFLAWEETQQAGAPGTLEGYHVLRTSLAHAPWQIIAVLSDAKLLKGHLLISYVTPFLIAAVLLVSLWMISLIFLTSSSRLVRDTIRDMTAELTESGILAGNEAGSNRDVYQLRDGVRQLMSRATGLVEDAYAARMRERNAALRALQAQINPHFLYNTLDTVYWQALEDGAQGAAGTIKRLADYFRISLSSGRDMITVDEELQMIDAYADILKERYGHTFTFQVAADPEAASLLIPKFTIQPVVENAFLHGISRRDIPTGGRVTVTVTLEDGTLHIAVTDNGPGFVPAQEEAAPADAAPAVQESQGFGLNNVRDRLDFYTGGRYNMSTHRQDGQTQVVICLPDNIKPLNIRPNIER